jgi:hypothetical protein
LKPTSNLLITSEISTNTTIGLGIAKEQQLEIVTPSKAFHETLSTTAEDKIVDSLVHDAVLGGVADDGRRHDLAQLVVVLGINLNALRAEDIPELQSSPNLQAFQ